jgi:hypothetical protein
MLVALGGARKMRGGVRPVDCFYEGENMLVIRADECIEISAMSALSQKQTFSDVRFLSKGATRDVRYGPKADIHANHSITSSAVV